MKLTDDTKLVAHRWEYTSHDGRRITMPTVYGYEREGETAEEIMRKARERYPEDTYEIMTLKEFEELDRRLTLARGVTEVDEETFHEMLDVLPPLKWVDRTCKKHRCKVNEFCMSEFEHNVYTAQYARAFVDGETRYYTATVDYYDESTWIHNRL